jgi:hypothetical protein
MYLGQNFAYGVVLDCFYMSFDFSGSGISSPNENVIVNDSSAMHLQCHTGAGLKIWMWMSAILPGCLTRFANQFSCVSDLLSQTARRSRVLGLKPHTFIVEFDQSQPRKKTTNSHYLIFILLEKEICRACPLVPLFAIISNLHHFRNLSNLVQTCPNVFQFQLVQPNDDWCVDMKGKAGAGRLGPIYDWVEKRLINGLIELEHNILVVTNILTRNKLC